MGKCKVLMLSLYRRMDRQLDGQMDNGKTIYPRCFDLLILGVLPFFPLCFKKHASLGGPLKQLRVCLKQINF